MKHYGITVSREPDFEDRLVVQHLRHEEAMSALVTIAQAFGEFGQAEDLQAATEEDSTSIEVVGADSKQGYVVTFSLVETA